MIDVLRRYLGQEIGINLVRPLHIDVAELVAVEEGYFTVRDEGGTTLHHIPYHSVLRAVEDPSGVTVGGLFTHKRSFPLVVKIAHVRDDLPT